jgi:putative ABC transport system permease protein
MFFHHVDLAFRNLWRNPVLSALIVGAIGVGIGATMTVLAVLRGMSGDPMPGKSSTLYSVRIDNWGPDKPAKLAADNLLSAPDALALMDARKGLRQAAMYSVSYSVTPPDPTGPMFTAVGRATGRDFFAMFNASFTQGGAWSDSEEQARAPVVVLGARAAARLFPAGKAVGRDVTFDGRRYRVVGVLDRWNLQPRIYDLTTGLYQETEDAFVPITTALAHEENTWGGVYCYVASPPGFEAFKASECRWMQYWVELPDPAQAAAYSSFVNGYVEEQRRIGRFSWQPKVGLYDARQWLAMANMVPDELRISLAVAVGFLAVCLLNAVALMLAKFSGRTGELRTRRALGASQRALFLQCLVEAGSLGVIGGLLGAAFTALGLFVERGLIREDYAKFTQIDASQLLLSIAAAIALTLCAGLYPAWVAGRAGVQSAAWT